MLKTTLATLALVALMPLTAQAHGPTRQKVVQSIEINAPAEKVWAAIGNFQDMSWHPAIAKTEGSGENGAGAKRMLTLKGGGRIDEALTAYNADAKAYSYEITAVDVKTLPVSNYSSSIRVTPGEGAKSTVEWKGAFYRGYVNNDPPEELNDVAAVAAVTGVYKSGLEALKAKLEAGG